MAGEEAIFNLKVQLDTTQLDAAINRALERIDEINARATSGVITRPLAQEQVAGVAKELSAAQALGVKQGLPADALSKFTVGIELARHVFGELGAGGKETTERLKAFDRDVLRGGQRLLKTIDEENKVVTKARQKTAANETALQDPEALKAQADSARRLKNAEQQANLAARGKYQEAIVANEIQQAKLTAEENALILKALEIDKEYLGNAATAAAAKKRQSAALQKAVQQELAGATGPASVLTSAKYISDLAQADVARKRIEQQRQLISGRELAGDPIYTFGQGELAAQRQQQAAREALVAEGLLAADKQYTQNTAKLAALRQRRGAEENAITQALLEADQLYLQSAVTAAASKKRQAASIEASVQRELAGETGVASRLSSAKYVSDLARADVARKRIEQQSALLSQQQLAGDPLYTTGQGQLAALRQQQQVREGLVSERILAADTDLAQQTGELAALRRQRAIKERQAFLLAEGQAGIQEEGRLAFQEDYRKSAIGAAEVDARRADPLLASSETLNAAKVEADEYRQQVARRAEVTRLNADHESEINEQLAVAKVSEQKRNLAVQKLTREKLGSAFAEEQAREEVAQSAAAETRRAAVIRLTLANEENLLQLKAQSLLQQKVLQARERELAQATLKTAIAQGEIARGTLVQRLQSRVAARAGGQVRLPTEFATGPQLLRGSLLTTARFAASGALLYGGFQAISRTVKEAQELEKILNQVRRQFESLGKADQFQGFSEGILRIARETGSAGAEVAFVGFQLQGAFGGNTQKALRETEAAFKAVKVTGLEIREVIDAFTALTQNFDRDAVSIENVSDTALGLQERFGVLAKETISFAADLAPVAAQAGFTVQQLEALGAVSQKYSGRTGASLAEAYGRIIPGIQSRAVEFTQLFQQLGAGIGDSVADAFQAGDIQQVFELLLRNYDSLSGAQKNYVIELLGGRREAAALIPVLEQGAELLAEFDRSQSDAGKTSQYFGDLQKTLTQQIAEFGEKMQQVGVQIYNAGLKDFFEDLIRLATGAAEILSQLLGILSSIGDAIGSIPGVGGGLTSVLQGLLLYKGIGAIRGRFGGGPAALTGAGQGALGGLSPSAAALLGAPLYGQGLTGRFAATRQAFDAAKAQALASTAYGGIPGGLRSTFAANAAGVGAGIKSAFTGFSWVGLGATVGLLAITEFSSGLRESAEKKAADIVGPDLRASDEEQEKQLSEFSLSLPDAQRIRRRISREGGTFKDFAKEIEDVAEDDLSLYQDALGSLFSGDQKDNKAAAQAFAEEEKKRILEQLQQISEAEEIINEVVIQSLSPEQRKDKDLVAKRQQAYAADIAALEAAFQADPDSVPLVTLESFFTNWGEKSREALAAIGKRRREQEEALEKQHLELITADEALARFDSGDAGIAETRQALAAAIATRRDLEYQTGDASQRKELADLIKREKEFQSEVLLRQAQTMSDAYEKFGGGNPQARLDIFTKLLKSGKLTPEGAKEAASGALDALQGVFDLRLAAAEAIQDEGARAQAVAALFASGIQVPKALQAELNYQFLTQASLVYDEFIFSATEGLKKYADAIARTAANIYAEGGRSWRSAIRYGIKAKINDLKAQRAALIDIYGGVTNSGVAAQIAGIDAEIAALQAQLPKVPDIGEAPDYTNYGKDPTRAAEAAKQASEDLAKKALAIRLAELELRSAQIEGAPVKEAEIEAQMAQAELDFARRAGDREAELQALARLVRARRAREEAQAEIRVSRRDYNVARRGDDPISAAKADLRNARDAVRLARGAAERLQAMAERERAERALADAIRDVGLARLELAQAIAEAAGDTVRAAQIALRAAKQQLAHLRRTSPNDKAAIIRAQADVVAQEAALRDAKLAEQTRQIDVALQLEKITVQQAISQLQALLQIPNLTQEQIDNILLKIKSLQDELKGDFRFNLPTQLYLPTAYEVRRLSQTGEGGYNDNRVINVTVNASTDADPDEIAATVASVVGQPNTTGTVPRKY